MGIDTIKVLYTYSIATLLIGGGILFLYFSRNDPPGGQAAALVPVVTGFIGAAVQFVFNRETQANTAAQIGKATAAANENAATVLTASGMPNVVTQAPIQETQP
jgi:hypothetical protein